MFPVYQVGIWSVNYPFPYSLLTVFLMGKLVFAPSDTLRIRMPVARVSEQHAQGLLYLSQSPQAHSGRYPLWLPRVARSLLTYLRGRRRNILAVSRTAHATGSSSSTVGVTVRLPGVGEGGLMDWEGDEILSRFLELA